MPLLINFTPFPNLRYYSWDSQGYDFGIVIVKATLEFDPDGRLVVAEEQAPMMFTDACHGAVNETSLWHPSDVVPNKPNTDVIVNMVARTRGGVPAASWVCGVEIGGAKPLRKHLRVTGPRFWKPKWRRALDANEKKEWRRHRRDFVGWSLSEPSPIAELPIHYEYAYGGLLTRLDREGAEVIDTDERNPLGRGWLDEQDTDPTAPQPAPQIEALDDPIREPFRRYTPQSLGPIPPAWLPRRPFGGTYDDEWKKNVWPKWALDYTFAFHNSAHPDLILNGYLKGDETIKILGANAENELVTCNLPGVSYWIDFLSQSGKVRRKRMNLDTLFLEVSAPKQRDWRVMLSWRVNFDARLFTQARIFGAELSAAETIKEGIK